MFKKITCVLLVLTIVFTSVGCLMNLGEASAASAWEELETEIETLDAQIAANKDKLDSLRGKVESQKEYLQTLELQIETVESKAAKLQTQIDAIDADINKLNNEIKQLNNEIGLINEEIVKARKNIKKLEENISETSHVLASRLRAAYVNGNTSTLKILLGSDSLSSFLTRLEMMKRTSENAKKSIDDFNKKIDKLESTKAQLTEDKKTLKLKKTEINEKRDSRLTKKAELKAAQAEHKKTVAGLELQYQEIEAYIAALDQSSAAYQSYIQQLELEREQADAELDRIISEYYATSTTATTTTTTQATTLPASNADPEPNGDSTTAQTTAATTAQTTVDDSYAGSGSWYWPLGNASCYISSGFGYRSASISGNSFHGGVDIAGSGITGKPVYATKGGRVITAVTSYTGYGIYVVIDHGNGYSSVYAHMSSRNVSTGDTVKQGQLIGRVGSTGNVTGPHLHFEIRLNGVKKDPMSYVKKP